MYDWTSNAILETPIKEAKAETIVECFKQNITYLSKRGFKPVYNIIYNGATKAIKTYLEIENIKVQFVTPYDHRVNAAERAIQNFKNHTISGLCICDEAFPSILWCKLIKQSQDTLNMLHTSRVHPKLSAFHVLEVHRNFNRVPFGPPGTRGTIFNPPETRGSYGPRALECWYVGPAWDHYRGMHFQIPSIEGYRTSAQYKLYPTHVQIPRETPMDRAVKIAGTLTTAIQNILKEPTINTGRQSQALEQLEKISDNATENPETQVYHKAQTSPTPTMRANIRATPRVHARVTRNITPGIIPTTIINTEGGKDFFPPIANSKGGQNSVRKINSKNERKTRQKK